MSRTKAKSDDDSTEQIKELVNVIAPYVLEYQKISAPIIKRWQIINATIMLSIVISVSILAFYKTIDGSAATGLIGAVIGYIFGGLYQQRK